MILAGVCADVGVGADARDCAVQVRGLGGVGRLGARAAGG
jgi:hypothetical protein